MNHKALLGTAVAAALMFGAQSVSACDIAAWSSATGLTAADAKDPTTGGKRYSGKCALTVSNASTPRFVTDTTPNDATYRVRFYYFTGALTGAAADIFQARNTAGTINIMRVTHGSGQLSFTTNGGGAAQTVTVQDNKYYAIELDWAAGAGTGSMTGTVTGAGSATPAGTISFTGLSNSADLIAEARLGLISGAPTVTNPVHFDEFDSRRTTSPGRLCRGDANGDSTVNVTDIGAKVAEILAPANPAVLTTGQPDTNESGGVDVSDIGADVAIILANTPCSAL